MMADRDHLAGVVELAQARRHFPHRDMRRAFDARLFPFPRLAHVEQQRLLATRVGEPPAMSARLVLSFEAGAIRSSTLFETVIAPLVNAERPSRFRF